MTRLLAWANVNQQIMALSNTGDECHDREGKDGYSYPHKTGLGAGYTISARQVEDSWLIR